MNKDYHNSSRHTMMDEIGEIDCFGIRRKDGGNRLAALWPYIFFTGEL